MSGKFLKKNRQPAVRLNFQEKPRMCTNFQEEPTIQKTVLRLTLQCTMRQSIIFYKKKSFTHCPRPLRARSNFRRENKSK